MVFKTDKTNKNFTLVGSVSLACLIALTGCASSSKSGNNKSSNILSLGLSKETINIAIVDEETLAMLPSVTCTMSDENSDVYHIEKNPTSLDIPVAAVESKLHIECSAPKYYQSQIAIGNKLNHWTYDELTVLPGYVVRLSDFPPSLNDSQLVIFMRHHALPSKDESKQQFNAEQNKEVFFQGVMAKNN